MKNKNNKISFQQLEQMIQLYKESHSQDADYLASEFFEAETLQLILADPKCKGVRVFNVLKQDGTEKQNRLVIVGVDEQGKIIIKNNHLASVSAAILGLGIGNFDVTSVAEHGRPCPPDCV